jgi:dihydroxyacetone kinase-like predicted kinase
VGAVLPIVADLTKPITEADGAVLTQLLVAGFIRMFQHKAYLNKINVFPMPDGDTGTNMVICLKNPTKNLLVEPSTSATQTITNFAADVLLNGQGNSGTILSHFFICFQEAIVAADAGETITIAQLAEALKVAGGRIVEALSNPMEGTILSVVRDSTRIAAERFTQSKGATLGEFMTIWNQAGQEELAKTPEQLEVNGRLVLKEAGVVDSAAAGFVFLMEGMSLACAGKMEELQDGVSSWSVVLMLYSCCMYVSS